MKRVGRYFLLWRWKKLLIGKTCDREKNRGRATSYEESHFFSQVKNSKIGLTSQYLKIRDFWTCVRKYMHNIRGVNHSQFTCARNILSKEYFRILQNISEHLWISLDRRNTWIIREHEMICRNMLKYLRIPREYLRILENTSEYLKIVWNIFQR